MNRWYPNGTDFYDNEVVKAITHTLKDREGILDLEELMSKAVLNDNIIRLLPNDPDYCNLRVNVVGLDTRKRRKEFPKLIEFCIERKLITVCHDGEGDYLYFDIIDMLTKGYLPKAYHSKAKNSTSKVKVKVDNSAVKGEAKVTESQPLTKVEVDESATKGELKVNESSTLMYSSNTEPVDTKASPVDKARFDAEKKEKMKDKEGRVREEDMPVADPTLPYPPFPLLNNKIWHCPVSLYGEWKKKYFMVDLDERLQHYSDMYFDSPTKRQYESQIAHALEFYLEADEKKAEKENVTEYQSIKNAISEAKETEREEATLSERLRSVNDAWVYLQENAPELFDGFCNGIKEYHDWETYVPYYRMKSIKEGNGSLATLEADTVHNALAVLKNADRLARMQAICNKFPDNIDYIFYDFCAKYHMNPDAVKEDFSFLEHNIRLKMEA